MLPKIKLDPCNDTNRIIIMYDGPSKKEADKKELEMIYCYCNGLNVYIPHKLLNGEIAPLVVAVKDVMVKRYGENFYQVLLKGEIVNENN